MKVSNRLSTEASSRKFLRTLTFLGGFDSDLLPPAKVMFLQLSVCPRGGGGKGGMCGRGRSWRGAGGQGRWGHAWQGGMRGMHAPPPADTTRYGDTVSERAVRILLECILVIYSL